MYTAIIGEWNGMYEVDEAIRKAEGTPNEKED